jgi:AbrB family looped-hinge helix DNA binding protein
MITTVTGKNQITIPAKLARTLDIQAGTRLDWTIDDDGQLIVQILPERGVLARRTAGMARPWLDNQTDSIEDLVRERLEDDDAYDDAVPPS